jgi:hypothetical protein
MPSTHQLTQRQIRCTQRQIRRMEKLPEGHKMVNTRYGAPIVRRPDGQLFRVQPNGRLAAAIRVERVRSYLDVHG